MKNSFSKRTRRLGYFGYALFKSENVRRAILIVLLVISFDTLCRTFLANKRASLMITVLDEACSEVSETCYFVVDIGHSDRLVSESNFEPPTDW